MTGFFQVHGFLSGEDRAGLQRAALDTLDVKGNVLEVGTLEGLSALVLLSAMHDDKTLTSVDINPQGVALASITRYGQAHRVKFINADIHNLALTEQYSLIFLDHDHTTTYPALVRLWPSLNAGGMMAIHDFGHVDFPDVMDSVNRFVCENLEVLDVVSDKFLFVVKKRR